MIRRGSLKRLVVVAEKTPSPARMAENLVAVAVSDAEKELNQLDSPTSAEDIRALGELEAREWYPRPRLLCSRNERDKRLCKANIASLSYLGCCFFKRKRDSSQ